MEKRKKTHIHYLTYFNTFISITIIVSLCVIYFSDVAPVEFVTKEICDSNGENCETNIDVINIAVQLGRLDFVSICLAIIGAAIAMGAIFGFLSIRDQAELVAGRAVREKWKYWEEEVMPKLIMRSLRRSAPFYPKDIADDSVENLANVVDEDEPSE